MAGRPREEKGEITEKATAGHERVERLRFEGGQQGNRTAQHWEPGRSHVRLQKLESQRRQQRQCQGDGSRREEGQKQE